MRYALLGVVLVLSGCNLPTIVQKTVTVEKDPQGQVLKRIEMESVTQQLGTRELKLEYIKIEEPPPPGTYRQTMTERR